MTRWRTRLKLGIVSVLLGLTGGGAGHAKAPSWQCELIEGVPPVGHPLREQPALRAASQAFERAQRPAQYKAVLLQFERALKPAWAASREAFEIAPPESKQLYKPDKARVFLERWVLKANAPLRTGRDAFEPAVGLAAMMAFSACQSGDVAAAIRLTRSATGAEAASLRAYAAWLLWQEGAQDQARELKAELNEQSFLGAFMLALMSEDAQARGVLLAKAQRVAYSGAQRAALIGLGQETER